MMSHDKLKHQVSQHFCHATKYSIARHEFLVVYDVTLYHDNYAHRYCHTDILTFTTSEVLRHAISLLLWSGIDQSLMLSQHSNKATGV